MKEQVRNRISHWEDWINVLLGAWVAILPWVYGFGDTAAVWNSHLVGLAVICVAVLAMVQFRQWEEWVNCVLGLWLVLSPWLLGYSDLGTATWNHVIVGLAVAAMALVEVWETRSGRQTVA